MNAPLILGVLGTALLTSFLYLKRWYGRRRIADVIFFAAFANGTAWALGAGAWLWFHESPRGYDAASLIGIVLFWFLLCGVGSLVPVAAATAMYHRLRRRE
jgi:hypothetical protein